MYRGDKTKCSVCGGGIYYGEHYEGCPKRLGAKVKPSASGYGVFLYLPSKNSFVARAMDTLGAPYRAADAIKIFKSKAAADKCADKLTDGTIAL